MKKKMILITLISLIGLLVSGVIYHLTGNQVTFSAAITFGTIFYHLVMRLAVGYLINARYRNQMDYTNKWFSERAFERTLYKKLQVKKWKNWFPTFNPEDFDIKSRLVWLFWSFFADIMCRFFL